MKHDTQGIDIMQPIMVRLLAVLIAFMLPSGVACAGACIVGSGIATFNPALTQLIAKGVGTTAWKGLAAVGPFTCTFPPGGGSYVWSSAGVGSLAAQGANGFDVAHVAKPAVSGLSTTSGTCHFVSKLAAGTSGSVPSLSVSASTAAKCTFYYNVHFALQQISTSLHNPVIPAVTLFGSGSAGTDAVVFSAGGINARAIRSTCAVTVSPTTVVLPSVSSASLASVGDTTGATPFTVTLQQCRTVGLAAYLTFHYTQGAAPGDIANTGTATDVQVRITNGTDTTTLVNGTPTRMVSVLNTGINAATYLVEYVRVANTGHAAGRVRAVAGINVTYQ